MKLKRNKFIKPFSTLEVERPWGHYGLYADNVKSTTKVLYVKPKQSLSLQFHFKRYQLYLILDNDFIIKYSKKPVSKKILNMPDVEPKFKLLEEFLNNNLITIKAKKGDIFGFKKHVVHRAIYNGNKKYGMILDVALGVEDGDENDENDIVRLKDDYGRSNYF